MTSSLEMRLDIQGEEEIVTQTSDLRSTLMKRDTFASQFHNINSADLSDDNK
jgi:hypothetical protein